MMDRTKADQLPESQVGSTGYLRLLGFSLNCLILQESREAHSMLKCERVLQHSSASYCAMLEMCR